MYNHFQLTKKYIHYYVTAANGKGHGMHSPFVFSFIQNVLNNKQNFQPPIAIEALRKELLHNNIILGIEDLGAGSRVHSSKKKTVAQIAKTAVKPKKYGKLFYRLVKYYQPNTIIELGTSLGITTSYMATANPDAQIITIEGSQAIAQIAAQNFKELQLSNIQLIIGNFDELLPTVIHPLSSLDLAYVDGNHRYEPTIHYFHQLLQKAHNNTILIFDDIHWSSEMERAWLYIKEHHAVRTTIDLFFIGVVLLRAEFKEKQHFTIRF